MSEPIDLAAIKEFAEKFGGAVITREQLLALIARVENTERDNAILRGQIRNNEHAIESVERIVDERDSLRADLAARDAVIASIKSAMALGPECGAPLPEDITYGRGRCRRQKGHDPKHTARPEHSRWPDKPDTARILAILDHSADQGEVQG